MNSIAKNTESSLRELGSKFLGFLFYCENEIEFKSFLDTIKSKYSDASHHCYAFRTNPNSITEFSSDDGEPNGTAGLPILNQLKSFDVVNAGIVVVRYFGGTKLGKSGLISTYGETAKLCLQYTSLKSIECVQMLTITYPYSEENLINKLKLNYNLKEQSAEYLANVKLSVACPIDKAAYLEQELAGLDYLNIQFSIQEKTFISD